MWPGKKYSIILKPKFVITMYEEDDELGKLHQGVYVPQAFVNVRLEEDIDRRLRSRPTNPMGRFLNSPVALTIAESAENTQPPMGENYGEIGMEIMGVTVDGVSTTSMPSSFEGFPMQHMMKQDDLAMNTMSLDDIDESSDFIEDGESNSGKFISHKREREKNLNSPREGREGFTRDYSGDTGGRTRAVSGDESPPRVQEIEPELTKFRSESPQNAQNKLARTRFFSSMGAVVTPQSNLLEYDER